MRAASVLMLFNELRGLLFVRGLLAARGDDPMQHLFAPSNLFSIVVVLMLVAVALPPVWRLLKGDPRP